MDASQRELAMELLEAIYGAGLGELVSEINIADTQNLTLTTRTGQVYRLGDRTDMATKLSLVAPVDAQLSAEGREPDVYKRQVQGPHSRGDRH